MVIKISNTKSGNKIMEKKKIVAGFTLIELLVVIAIIGLLLAIIVPSLNKAKYVARRVICAGRMNQIGVAMKLYADANKEMLPTNKAVVGGNEQNEMHGYVVYRSDWAYASGKLIPLRFARLFESGLIDMPEIFYCPNNRADTWKYDSYVNPQPWGTLPQVSNTTSASNQWVRIGLTYFPVERNPTLIAGSGGYSYPDPDRAVTKYTSLNMNMPYASDVLHTLKNVSHQYNSQFDANGEVTSWGTMAVNCLYGDGRVTTCTDMSVFKDPVWKRFGDGSSLSYDTCYYNIFKLMGP
jgi:prepilin-type N-terminal cleavage/methylation domain-containing protein